MPDRFARVATVRKANSPNALKTFDNLRVPGRRPRPVLDEIVLPDALIRIAELPQIAIWWNPGLLHENVTSPIAPAVPPNDTMLYEMPSAGEPSGWLPRWRLRHSQSRYEIAMRALDDGRWAIVFGLERFAAAEVAAAAAAGAPALEADLSALIRFRYDGSAVERVFPVDELASDARGQTATLRLSLSDRDSLLRAFRNPAAAATLIMVRHVDLAVGRPYDSQRDGRMRDRFRLPIDRRVLTTESLRFPPPVDENAAGSAVGIGRRRINPQILDTDLLRVQPMMMSEHVRMFEPYITLPAFGDGTVETPAPYEPPARPEEPAPEEPIVPVEPDLPIEPPIPTEPVEPPIPIEPIDPVIPFVPNHEPPPPTVVYDQQIYDLSCEIELRFDQAEHPYLFPSGIAAAQGATLERVLVADPETGRTHAYLRDEARGNLFFYLPDSFKLSRRQQAPFTPALLFRVDQGDGADDVQVEMSAYLAPVISPRRLRAALTGLAAHTVASADGDARLELQPLVAEARLRLNVPRGGAVTSEDNPAVVDLVNSFLLTERFAFVDFVEVSAALATKDAVVPLLLGSVLVKTGLAADEIVPAQLRFDDMAGNLFTSVEAVSADGGGVTCVLRNATESPLRVASLGAMLVRGETSVAARLDGLPALPVDLAPDAELSLVAVPEGALPGEGPIDAVFDTNGVSPLTDMERIRDLTMDRSIAQQSKRPITVLTSPALLAGTSGDPILMVVVEFTGNRSVRVDAATPTVIVDVPVPLADLLSHREGESGYRYRQTIVYASGRQVKDADWRNTDAGVLVVPLQA